VLVVLLPRRCERRCWELTLGGRTASHPTGGARARLGLSASLREAGLTNRAGFTRVTPLDGDYVLYQAAVPAIEDAS
jgi:hypothetical protein